MTSAFVRICEKAGLCNRLATKVLIYINKTTFQEITDRPKFYCVEHALYLQTFLAKHHGIQSRIYSVDEWKRRVNAWELENKAVLREREEKMFDFQE